MKRLEIKKAAQDEVASILWRVKSNGIKGNGLGSKDTGKRFARSEIRIARLRDDCADGSGRRPSWANMLLPLRSKRCELGGLLHCCRRMTAAPAFTGNVAFSLAGIRTHGLIVPALYRSCGLMPCGEPLRSPLPTTRSANPHGVAHLLAERGGFRQFVVGVSHE